MKTTTLNCANCGAPLQLPVDTKVTQCGHCNAYLAVELIGDQLTIARLKKLEDSTESLDVEIREVKNALETERLDRQWERERRRFAQSRKDGRIVMPSRESANWVAIAGLSAAIICWLFACGLYRSAKSTQSLRPPTMIESTSNSGEPVNINRRIERRLADSMREINYELAQKRAKTNLKFSQYLVLLGGGAIGVGLILRQAKLAHYGLYESARDRYEAARAKLTTWPRREE